MSEGGRLVLSVCSLTVMFVCRKPCLNVAVPGIQLLPVGMNVSTREFCSCVSSSWQDSFQSSVLPCSWLIDSVIDTRPESHFVLCFWLDTAAKWLESRLEMTLTTQLDWDILWLKSATFYADYTAVGLLQPCSPVPTCHFRLYYHTFNLSSHAGHDASLPSFKMALFKIKNSLLCASDISTI